jgi:hypothetical protein
MFHVLGILLYNYSRAVKLLHYLSCLGHPVTYSGWSCIFMKKKKKQVIRNYASKLQIGQAHVSSPSTGKEKAGGS